VEAVGLALALLDLGFAVAGQLAQGADRLRRHEARPQKTRLGELAEPGGVCDVGLAPRHLLDVAGVDEDAFELVLEDRPDWLPVDAGRLHRDLGDAVGGEPVAQGQQPRHRGRELGKVLLASTAIFGRAHAGGHLRLVDIERPGALNDRLHLVLLGSG
jgi:hypothetical protein